MYKIDDVKIYDGSSITRGIEQMGQQFLQREEKKES